MSSPNARPVMRRRQRSARVTAAVVLIMIATLAVLGALVGGSSILLAVSAVTAVLFGAAATKITHSELLQSRRDAARDRAQQAQEYRVLDEAKSAENQEFARTMTDRIATRQKLIHELEGVLAGAHRTIAQTKLKLGSESRRADQAERRLDQDAARLEQAESRAAEAIVSVAELEQEVTDLKAELAAWEQVTVRKRA